MSTVSSSVPITKRLHVAALDIKLAHSVFALPFALIGAFMVRPAGSPGRFAGQLAIIVACMVFARTWAMLFNRIADARIDERNPRTSRRALPSGALTTRDAWSVALGAAALFIGCTSLFLVFFDNAWPLMLSVPVLLWIAFYSLTKRFTLLCHLFLGGALAASPIAAAIAIDPASLGATPALWWIAGMVLLWVAGFDVIYALQDLDFDRTERVRSVPAALGPRGACNASRLLHLGAFACLLLAWRADPRLGLLFGLSLVPVGLLLVAEHVVLARRGQAGLQMSFFTLNGVISCLLGLTTCIDLL